MRHLFNIEELSVSVEALYVSFDFNLVSFKIQHLAVHPFPASVGQSNTFNRQSQRTSAFSTLCATST